MSEGESCSTCAEPDSGAAASIVENRVVVKGLMEDTASDRQSGDSSANSSKSRNVKALLEKLSEFLTENNLEEQIQEERKDIHRKIDHKNEEISQKRETHRHKLNEIHEAYKREIQRENERHLEDLKVTELDISSLRLQLQELEQLNITVTSKIPCSKSNSSRSDRDSGRVRELLECPVCLEEMRPPKKIFQCSNGHVICELCKNNPEVRSCPTCRVKFRGNNVVRNIVAEKLARNTYDSSDSDENMPRSSHTRESNPVESGGSPEEFHILGYITEEDNEERDDDDDDFLASLARIVQEEGSGSNHHRRLSDPPGSDDMFEQHGQGRDISSLPVPRLREAHLIRTYRHDSRSRYIPHHMRRQRNSREEDEVDQDSATDRPISSQERSFVRAPRISRRSGGNYPFLR